MNRKMLISFAILLILILSACASSNTTAEPQKEAEGNEKEIKGQTEQDAGGQTVHYKDLSLTIPSDWSAEEEDEGFVIRSTSDSGFGCLINAFDISQDINDRTTRDDIYDYCLQSLGTDDTQDIRCEKGDFKGCPAIFYSFSGGDDETDQTEFGGVCFAADTWVYLYTVGSYTGEVHEDEKQIAQEIQNSIVIDPSVNVSRYDNATSLNEDTANSTESNVKGLVFDKGVVYDGNDILISTDKIEGDNTLTTFSFVIQNNSDTDYDIETDSWDINGIMMSGYCSAEVAAGKKAKLNLTVNNDVLSSYNIDTISELDMVVWADVDAFRKWNTGLINAKTNQYSQDGRAGVDIDPYYSDDVVDVWYAGGNEIDEFTFFIYNKSNNNAYCTIKNCSVNDWSYDLTDYTYDAYRKPINSKAYTVITIPIDEEFANMNDIARVESMEYNVLFENGDWEYQSEKIAFTRQENTTE